MPKFINKNRLKWVSTNWDFKYIEPIEKIKEKVKKEEVSVWEKYFGFDGTSLEHDILSCPQCKVSATER